MNKEDAKMIFNNWIDSVDEVQDLSVYNDVEETDASTLDESFKERKLTGITSFSITGYKELK